MNVLKVSGSIGRTRLFLGAVMAAAAVSLAVADAPPPQWPGSDPNRCGPGTGNRCAGAAAVETWECGSPNLGDVTATYYDDGTLVVSGSGRMEDYQASAVGIPSAPWSNLLRNNHIKEIVIEDGVTYIGMNAFSAFPNALESVTCLSETPPCFYTCYPGVGVGDAGFSTPQRPNLSLFVPLSSIGAYRDALVWKDFGYFNPSTVTFDLQGGTGDIPPQKVSFGGKVTKPQDPAREGYTFDGWCHPTDVVTLCAGWNFDNNSVIYNIELHAVWTPNTPVVPGAVNAAAPVISAQPEGGTVAFNPQTNVHDPITLSVTASSTDGGALSYKWYQSSNYNTCGEGMLMREGTGAEGASYTFYYNAPTGGGSSSPPRYFCVIVTNTIPDNGDGGVKSASVASNVAEVVVQPTSSVVYISRAASSFTQVSVRGRTLSVKMPSSAVGVENFQPLQIRIVDMRGKTVKRFKTQGGGSFSLSGVSAGRYIAEVQGGGKRLRSAFVLR